MKSVTIGIDLDLYSKMADDGTLNPTAVRKLLEYCNDNSEHIEEPPVLYVKIYNTMQTVPYRLRLDEDLHKALMSKKGELSYIEYTAYLLNNLYSEFVEVVING